MSESSSSAPPPLTLRRVAAALVQWFDSDHTPDGPEKMRQEPDKVDWMRCIPFLILHGGCLGVIWVGVSAFAAWSAVALYVVRMFAVTGIYHRYFSHKTYSTSRFGQFLLALWGATTVQRGALWWAYHHRHHHQHSDDPEDAHSPHVHGFWWSHIGWITSRRNFPTDYSKVKDLAKFPELVWLNRFDTVIPILFAIGTYVVGSLLAVYAPQLGTNGPQLLVWAFFISTTALFHGTSCINSMAHLMGKRRFATTDDVWAFFISTTALFHGTSCINSMAHLMGKRRFATTDDSRNSFILAIICLGEGWHNNHHRYQSSTRNGFYWWEIDLTYYGLKALSWTGLIWGLKPVPQSIMEEAARADHHATIAAAQRAAHSHPEYSSLKKVVPAAAAIAVATATAAQANLPKKAEGPAIHKDVSSLNHPDAKTPPSA